MPESNTAADTPHDDYSVPSSPDPRATAYLPTIAEPHGNGLDAPHCPACPSELSDHPRYEVLELLGAGGMGCVYKARHRFMDRVVALKVLNRHLLDRPGMVERFLQEVRAAGRLAHPNIVQAFDADQAGDMHFLVMEFVPGVNLDQVVTEQGALPVARACAYARQTALGLQHAHECGMVHRDIKPHNLMLTDQDTVKILDFGLARYASEAIGSALPGGEAAAIPPPEGAGGVSGTADWAAGATRHRNAEPAALCTYPGVGTPDYMAPEEILDPRQADIRADIYSLGCTLYRFLTGRVPFPETTALAKLRAHLRRPPEPVAELRPEIPRALAGAVQRMMAKEAGARPQTPAEVVQALTPFTDCRRRHILVVDDEPDSRDSLAMVLGFEGYQVSCAANGRAALERLRRGPRPDLILLDMLMPVMDGWQLLHELRKEPELAAIPVVVLSAAEQARARAVVFGIADSLKKPYPVEELATIIKRHTGAA